MKGMENASWSLDSKIRPIKSQLVTSWVLKPGEILTSLCIESSVILVASTEYLNNRDDNHQWPQDIHLLHHTSTSAQPPGGVQGIHLSIPESWEAKTITFKPFIIWSSYVLSPHLLRKEISISGTMKKLQPSTTPQPLPSIRAAASAFGATAFGGQVPGAAVPAAAGTPAYGNTQSCFWSLSVMYYGFASGFLGVQYSFCKYRYSWWLIKYWWDGGLFARIELVVFSSNEILSSWLFPTCCSHYIPDKINQK